jgi:hypothetical protein
MNCRAELWRIPPCGLQVPQYLFGRAAREPPKKTAQKRIEVTIIQDRPLRAVYNQRSIISFQVSPIRRALSPHPMSQHCCAASAQADQHARGDGLVRPV